MVKKLLFTLAVSLLFTQISIGQNRIVDSLINYVNTHRVDSAWILNCHKISYRLSETDVKKSFAYYEKVSSASDSMNFLYGKALAQINLALLLFNSANFSASNQAYFKAMEYAEKGGYDRLYAISLNNIGENFLTLKDYDKCREYAVKAIAFNEKLKPVDVNKKMSSGRAVAINYELLFRCDMEEQKYQQAAADLDAGIKDAEDSKDSYVISPYYLGYGRLQVIYQRPDSATFYFTKALTEAEVENDLRNVYEVLICRATTPLGQTPQQRLADLYTALKIARETEYLKGIADAADRLSRAYDAGKNKDSALNYFRIYRSASDSLFSENNKRNVIIKESEWILRKKDLENNQLKNVTNLQHKEIVAKNSLLIGGAVTLVLAIALGVLAYTNIRNKKRRAELQQKKQEAELKSQITDMEFKAFKAQLNPHFIFNYLNSVSGYILLSQPEKASDMIKRFSRMLRKVLQNSELNEVSLADDIKTIEQYIDLMHEIASPPFSYAVVASDEIRHLTKTVPPLFIQPYVENAIIHGLKHAEGNDLSLTIIYQKKGTALQVTITDTGTGFSPKILRSQQLTDGEHIHLGLSVTEKRVQVFAEKNGYDASIQFTTPHPDTTQPGTVVEVLIDKFFA